MDAWSMPPTGLYNVGSTCCANTLIQCMFHTPALFEFIHTGADRAETSALPRTTALWQPLRELFKEMHTTGERALKPRAFLRSLVVAAKGLLQPGEQWDLDEVWTLLIDRRTDELKGSMGEGASPQGYPSMFFETAERRYQMAPMIDKANGAWVTAVGRSDPLWSLVTHGLLIGQMQCLTCKYTCHNLEPFTSISVPIRAQEEPVTLNDCFFDYFKTESIDEWTCDHCKEKRSSEKLARFWTASDVLAIHIKRFGYRDNGHSYHIKTPLAIPDDFTIQVGTEIAYEKNKRYRLRAIGLHYGGIHGGHYVALCRCALSKDGGGGATEEAWYLFDDDHVQKVSREDVAAGMQRNRNAYMLFYERYDGAAD